MREVKVLHLDHPKVYAKWTVIIGGGKSPIKGAKKPPTTRKSTAKLSHQAKVQGRLKPALARGQRLRVLNVMFYPLGHGRPRSAPVKSRLKSDYRISFMMMMMKSLI